MNRKIVPLYTLVCGNLRNLQAICFADWNATSRFVTSHQVEIDSSEERISANVEVPSLKTGLVPIYLEVLGDEYAVTERQLMNLHTIVASELRDKVFPREVSQILLSPRAEGSLYIEILGEDLEKDGNVIQRRIIRSERLENLGVSVAMLYPELQLV